ncbi:MAG: VanW family protein [Candidatus Moranbacteria bacterium]|nr:VanW family protein [Candidatus Moranbacteria bacterium]
MVKYIFTASLGLCLLAANAASAATDNQPIDSKTTDGAASVLTLTVDQYSDQISKDDINKWTKNSNSFSLSPVAKTEFENTTYCPTDKLFCFLTLTRNQRQYLHLSSKTSLDMEAIKSHLEDLARKVNRDPAEAKFKVENGVVTSFGESQNGITLDVDKSLQIIADTLNKNISGPQTIALSFASKKPQTNYGDVNNLGITSLIGEGTSNFKGSPKNRIFNIKVAAERFNGLLIKPGEEFSFVKNLGEVDGEHGYLPELVIKNNVTEPEFGGGICQVSTTAFRAAIYSGLKITARRNHAYPVSYYNPQGMDSTVYVPNPDLRFLNNTPNYILIQTKIVGTVLTFDFYGTDDGRKTTVDGPYITDKQPDGSLKAHFSQTVVDKDGKEFINDVFNSSYGSPYKYPHPGGPVLTVKPANWSNDEWKAYKKTAKNTP